MPKFPAARRGGASSAEERLNFGIDEAGTTVQGTSVVNRSRHHRPARNNRAGPYLGVGARRFELPPPCPPCRCATRLRYAPTAGSDYSGIIRRGPAAAVFPPVPAGFWRGGSFLCHFPIAGGRA